MAFGRGGGKPMVEAVIADAVIADAVIADAVIARSEATKQAPAW